MLHVTVEIWPSGDRNRKRTLAELDIENVSNLAEISDYGATLAEEHGDPHLRATHEPPRARHTKIYGHERAAGWAPLLVRVLNAFFSSPTKGLP